MVFETSDLYLFRAYIDLNPYRPYSFSLKGSQLLATVFCGFSGKGIGAVRLGPLGVAL